MPSSLFDANGAFSVCAALVGKGDREKCFQGEAFPTLEPIQAMHARTYYGVLPEPAPASQTVGQGGSNGLAVGRHSGS